MCTASVICNEPPNDMDKRVIGCFRKYWREITKRVCPLRHETYIQLHQLSLFQLWEEPENTLKPQETHVLERVAFPQLVIRMLICDISFMSYVPFQVLLAPV